MTEPTPETHCGSCDQHQRVDVLSTELANIHRVHIDDIRGLLRQFESEQDEWAHALQQAKANECNALCSDIENDRDVLAEENRRLRDEGTPGVMHGTDRAFYQAMIADRDRFAHLHRSLGDRNQRLITAYRGARYAVKLVDEVETLLGVALGKPGSVSRDNMLAAVGALAQDHDQYREQAMSLALPDSNINRNEQIIAALQQKIGEAVGTDIGRDRMVEIFDRLVSQYRAHESMQDTIETQKRTIDMQLEDIAIQKRITEAQGRQIAALKQRRTELIKRTMAAGGRSGEWPTRPHGRGPAGDREISEAITSRDESLAEWSRRYDGLESASQAVGQQLARQIRRTGQLRGRLRVADDLLHEVNGIVCSAENLKLTLKCTASHCAEGNHLLDPDNPVPIGDQDWRDAQRRWAERWHAFMDSDRPDPLDGFTMRPFSDGASESLLLFHAGDCAPRVYRGGETKLPTLIYDAYWHLDQVHTERPDEASPAATDSLDGGGCHPGRDVRGGNIGTTPIEANE